MRRRSGRPGPSGSRRPANAAAVVLLLAWAATAAPAAPTTRPLPRAHAHNDYQHRRPLVDALDAGFCSVEADVHLVGGKLLVAHDALGLRPGRTLEALYLEPLRQRVAANGGKVHAGPGAPATLTLLVDLKTEAEVTYAALREVLKGYGPLITRWEDGREVAGPVTVIISGNRPRQTMLAEKTRWAAYDGRLPDLDADDPPPATFVPLVSSSWGPTFRWRGQGPMPEAERARLRELVARAHAQGRRIRFWGAPDRVEAWRELHAAGVDLINTDRLKELSAFLLETAEAAAPPR